MDTPESRPGTPPPPFFDEYDARHRSADAALLGRVNRKLLANAIEADGYGGPRRRMSPRLPARLAAMRRSPAHGRARSYSPMPRPKSPSATRPESLRIRSPRLQRLTASGSRGTSPVGPRKRLFHPDTLWHGLDAGLRPESPDYSPPTSSCSTPKLRASPELRPTRSPFLEQEGSSGSEASFSIGCTALDLEASPAASPEKLKSPITSPILTTRGLGSGRPAATCSRAQRLWLGIAIAVLLTQAAIYHHYRSSGSFVHVARFFGQVRGAPPTFPWTKQEKLEPLEPLANASEAPSAPVALNPYDFLDAPPYENPAAGSAAYAGADPGMEYLQPPEQEPERVHPPVAATAAAAAGAAPAEGRQPGAQEIGALPLRVEDAYEAIDYFEEYEEDDGVGLADEVVPDTATAPAAALDEREWVHADDLATARQPLVMESGMDAGDAAVPAEMMILEETLAVEEETAEKARYDPKEDEVATDMAEAVDEAGAVGEAAPLGYSQPKHEASPLDSQPSMAAAAASPLGMDAEARPTAEAALSDASASLPLENTASMETSVLPPNAPLLDFTAPLEALPSATSPAEGRVFDHDASGDGSNLDVEGDRGHSVDPASRKPSLPAPDSNGASSGAKAAYVKDAKDATREEAREPMAADAESPAQASDPAPQPAGEAAAEAIESPAVRKDSPLPEERSSLPASPALNMPANSGATASKASSSGSFSSEATKATNKATDEATSGAMRQATQSTKGKARRNKPSAQGNLAPKKTKDPQGHPAPKTKDRAPKAAQGPREQTAAASHLDLSFNPFEGLTMPQLDPTGRFCGIASVSERRGKPCATLGVTIVGDLSERLDALLAAYWFAALQGAHLLVLWPVRTSDSYGFDDVDKPWPALFAALAGVTVVQNEEELLAALPGAVQGIEQLPRSQCIGFPSLIAYYAAMLPKHTLPRHWKVDDNLRLVVPDGLNAEVLHLSLLRLLRLSPDLADAAARHRGDLGTDPYVAVVVRTDPRVVSEHISLETTSAAATARRGGATQEKSGTEAAEADVRISSWVQERRAALSISSKVLYLGDKRFWLKLQLEYDTDGTGILDDTVTRPDARVYTRTEAAALAALLVADAVDVFVVLDEKTDDLEGEFMWKMWRSRNAAREAAHSDEFCRNRFTRTSAQPCVL